MRVLEGEERTRQWLEGLVANDAAIYPNNIAVLDAANRGEIRLGLINHYYWYEQRAEEGQDPASRLERLPADDPGALVNVAGAGVLAANDQGEQAQTLVDYLLSEPAQRYFAEELFEFPVAAGVAPPEGLPPLSEVPSPDVDLSDLDSLSETLQLLDDVGLT